MTMNPLPPQAYTKDTMLKAYSWLQNQNDSIKGLAITPDILVSLYLKAKMNGEESLDRPSIQNFKAELKNLAGLMGEFESKNEKAQDRYRHIGHAAHATHGDRPVEKPFVSGNFSPAHENQVVEKTVEKSVEKFMEKPSEATRPIAGLDLDVRSQTMIREVKSEFNLGSDQEALRLLISLGFKRMKNLE